MIVMDARVVRQDARGALKVITPKLQRALADFAAMRPSTPPATPARAGAAVPLTLVIDEPAPAPRTAPPTASRTAPPTASRTPLPAASRTPPPTASRTPPAPALRTPPPAASRTPPAPAPRTAPAAKVSPSAAAARAPMTSMGASAGQTNKGLQGGVTPEIDRLHDALRRSPIALHVQRLVALTKGSQLRRYEVLLRLKSDSAPNAAPTAMLKAAVENGLGSMIDRRVVTELIGYLVNHPEIWRSTAVMFSVNLTTTALHDDHFIKFVELCLAKSSLPKGMIAFEVDTATAVKLGDRIVEVAASLHRLGCPLVLDDFALKTECFDLLRLPGVHYVKLAPSITTKMRTDKLSQAAITAVVQMARVLGMHTVAKRTETAAEQEWLTALGVDFIQSNSLSPPVAIETLAKPASSPKPVPTH